MRTLRALQLKFRNKIDIHIFGCTNQEIKKYGLIADFNYTNHKILIRQKVANLLRKSHIFINLSDYQAFGRTGIEAMACGCIPVLPVKGGVNEYAIDYWNSIIVDTSRKGEILAKISNFLIDIHDKIYIFQNAISTSKNYTSYRSALSILLALQMHTSDTNKITQ
jgi:glycosyltransferase involved in cell wall biosynthesis